MWVYFHRWQFSVGKFSGGQFFRGQFFGGRQFSQSPNREMIKWNRAGQPKKYTMRCSTLCHVIKQNPKLSIGLSSNLIIGEH